MTSECNASFISACVKKVVLITRWHKVPQGGIGYRKEDNNTTIKVAQGWFFDTAK